MRRKTKSLSAEARARPPSACAPRRVHLSGLSVLDMSGSVGPCAPAVWRIVAFLAGRTACMRLAKEDMKMVSLSLLTTVLDGWRLIAVYCWRHIMDHVPGKIEGHIPGTRVMTAAKSILRNCRRRAFSGPASQLDPLSTMVDGGLIMSGDCGGTNSRLTLFKVPAGTVLELGVKPPGQHIPRATACTASWSPADCRPLPCLLPNR